MKTKGILETFLEEVILILVFQGVGNAIATRLELFRQDSNIFYILAFSYFAGLLCNLTLVRFLDLFLHNVRLTYVVVIVLDFYIGIYESGIQNICRLMGQFDWKVWMSLFCFCIILAVIVGIENNSFFSIDNDRFCEGGELSVYSSLGTLHTPRSTNIAITITKENRIPMIGINYGPSLILVFFRLLKNPYLYFANYIFTVCNNTIMFFFFIGMFQEFFNLSLILAIFGALIVCWGGEGIGIRYKMPTDGASCTYWGLSSTYPDVLAAFSWFLTWLYQLFLLMQGEANLVSVVVYSVLCALVWCIISPQFFVLAAGIMLSNIVLFSIWNFTPQFLWRFGVTFIVLLFGGLIASYFGGGLLNQSGKTRKNIEGAGRGSGLILGHYGVILVDLQLLGQGAIEYNIISRKIKEIAQALFYPFMSGILWIIFCLSESADAKHVFMGVEMLLLMLGGLIIEIAFSNRQAGSKEELTRFLTPAFVVSRIVYIIVLAAHVNHYGMDQISMAGIVIAVSMVVFELPYHILFIQRACNRKLYELLPMWFRKADLVYGAGRYDGESRFNQQLLQKMNVELDKIFEKKIYIYGTGKTAQWQFHEFKQRGMDVIGFVDSDPKKWNQDFAGLKIYSPYCVSKKQDENTVVVIGSEITAQIISIYRTGCMCRIKNIAYVSEIGRSCVN